jgi:hypothetical protein
VFSKTQFASVSPFHDVLHNYPKDATSNADAVFCLDMAVYLRAITGKANIRQTILGS